MYSNNPKMQKRSALKKYLIVNRR